MDQFLWMGAGRSKDSLQTGSIQCPLSPCLLSEMVTTRVVCKTCSRLPPRRTQSPTCRPTLIPAESTELIPSTNNRSISIFNLPTDSVTFPLTTHSKWMQLQLGDDLEHLRALLLEKGYNPAHWMGFVKRHLQDLINKQANGQGITAMDKPH